jgi:hypothetical protein
MFAIWRGGGDVTVGVSISSPSEEVVEKRLSVLIGTAFLL